jgi:UDP-2,3-diacylglucosamine pyrophosphatase LpxH
MSAHRLAKYYSATTEKVPQSCQGHSHREAQTKLKELGEARYVSCPKFRATTMVLTLYISDSLSPKTAVDFLY